MEDPRHGYLLSLDGGGGGGGGGVYSVLVLEPN